MSRCFIPAKLTDNPYIDIAGYMKRLSSLPPTQRKMLRDGDWTVTDGRFFPEFNESHIIEPFPIPKGWQCYRGVDYGFASPFACVWVAAAPDGHFYVYREIYKTNLRDIEQANEIALMSKEPIEYTMCDPSMRSKNSSGTSPFESYFQNNIPMILADNDRVLGWMSLRNYLSPHQDGTPILKIFNTATNLIREFQTAIVSSKNPEDLDSRGSDHALDALRYWSRSRAFALPPAQPDPFSHLNPESKREWENIKKEREKQTNKLPLQNISQLYPAEDYSEVISFSDDSDF